MFFGLNLLWWWLSCRDAAVRPPPRQAPSLGGGPWEVTGAGRYRIATTWRPNTLAVRLLDASGLPVEDAALTLKNATTTADLAVLADPGECDSEGPVRCLHPDGRYLLYLGDGRLPERLWLQIDAPMGPDRIQLLSAELTAPDR